MSLMTKAGDSTETTYFDAHGSDVRTELIARIRRQIEDGTYDTDVKMDVCVKKLLHHIQNTSES